MNVRTTRCLLASALLAAACHTAPVAAFARQTEPVKRIRVSAGVEEAKLLHRVPPIYPPEARAAGISGTVRFRAVIATDGTVNRLDVVSGDPALIPAAKAAALQWTYKPTLLENEPIEVETWIDVVFSLMEPFTPSSGTAQPSAQPIPGGVTIGGSPGQPVLLHRVLPVCWPEAKDVHDAGTVELRVLISADGNVKEVQVASGDSVLAAAAVDAARQWRFQAALRDGNPAEVETFVKFVFAGPLSVATPGFEVPSRPNADQKLEVSQARLIRQVPPKYPDKARKRRISGTVRIHGYISKDGILEEPEVRSGDPLLARAALDAVRNWRYQPADLNGERIRVDTCIDVRFELTPR